MQEALIDSVKGSNAIEGIITTRQRIEDMAYGKQEPLTHDEQEILGYKNALNEIYTDYKSLDISEDLIRHFHNQILSFTSTDAGQYKTQNNYVQERYADGTVKVRFIPVDAKDTPDAMHQLIMAYYEAKQDSSISSLLLISCFVLDFLCIHPFTDGNGRISRLLTVLLLEQSGFDIGRYASVENKIDDYKSGYYDALKKSSDGWNENASDYVPFATFMLQILYACYKQLDESFLTNQSKRVSKQKRIENILLNSIVPISKEDILRKVPDISVTTVERVLGNMLHEGAITKIGTTRGARYKVSGGQVPAAAEKTAYGR